MLIQSHENTWGLNARRYDSITSHRRQDTPQSSLPCILNPKNVSEGGPLYFMSEPCSTSCSSVLEGFPPKKQLLQLAPHTPESPTLWLRGDGERSSFCMYCTVDPKCIAQSRVSAGSIPVLYVSISDFRSRSKLRAAIMCCI